jgi:homocysteine S-methyltransferase
VFDLQTFERLYKRIEGARVPIIVGLWPFESALNAEYMANEVPGVSVPETVLDRMRRAPNGGAVAEGIAIARELGAELKGVVQGVRIASPSGRVEDALAVLSGIR